MRTLLLTASLAGLVGGLGPASGCAETRRRQPDPVDAGSPGDAMSFPCQPGQVRACNPPLPPETLCAPGEQRCEAIGESAGWGPCEGAILCLP